MLQEPVFTVQSGFSEAHRTDAAALFWDAFKAKLAPVMKPEDKALRFLARVADSGHAIGAVSADGSLLGVAGFKTANGAFIGGGLGDLTSVYGPFGGLWRGMLLSLLERPVEEGVLLMDGICVSAAARGQGVGTALLDAIKAHARALGCDRVRLDVIDSNPRARALYERQGFVAGETGDIGPLRLLFGFRRATTMECRL